MISYVQHFGFHDCNFRGHMMMSHGPVYSANILFSLVTIRESEEFSAHCNFPP